MNTVSIKRHKAELSQSESTSQPNIHVFVVEDHNYKPEGYYSGIREIAKEKSYHWQMTFEERHPLLGKDRGSCAILITCAADLADTCRFLTKIGWLNESMDSFFDFDIPEELTLEFASQGKTLRKLDDKEKIKFNRWFQATFDPAYLNTCVL